MKTPQDLLTPPNPPVQELSSLLEKSAEGLKTYHLIVTAWEAGVFEHTATPKTAKQLSEELGGYHEAMLQLFLDTIAEVGLLTKTADAYTNTPLSNTYLCTSSPYYMEHALRNMKTNIDRWGQLPSIIKNGPIKANRSDFFNQDWLIGIAENARAGTVANVLSNLTSHLDPKGWRRLLDLGGGHGLYAIAFTALNPQLEAYVFDLPAMTTVTERFTKEYNATSVHILPGDFTKDGIGGDYDVIFSSFNQSCLDPALITKMAAALTPGGYLVLRRFKDSTRKGALKTLDWNLLGFEGKKIGSKSHSGGAVADQKTYHTRLEQAGLKILGTHSVDAISELTIAQKT